MIATAENLTAHEPVPSEHGLPAYLEVWHILRRRKGRIVGMLLVAVALATVFCVLTGPRFDSTAQLLVIKKRLDTTPITGPDQARGSDDYLSTHMLLITSRRVIGRAIEQGNLQSLPQFQDKGGLRREISDWAAQTILGGESEVAREEKLTTDIINSLLVTRDAQRPGISPSNEVINLSFRSNVAADGPKVINAIIDSYQEDLAATYRNTNAETLELIAQARLAVQKDLEVKETAYQKFLAETPPLWKTQDRSTAQQDRLFKIDGKLAAMRMRRTEIEASIAMIETAIKSGRNPTAIVMRMLMAPGSEGNAMSPLAGQDPARPRLSLEEELVSVQLQKTRLEAIHPKNHPDVVAINRQLQEVRRMLLPSGGAEASTKDINLGAIKVELLRQELDDLKVSEQALAKLFDQEQTGVSASYLHEIQNETHRKGIERDRMLYESILNRLKETSSVKDFGGYNTQVIGSALPGALAVKRYLLVYGLSVFVGFFLGFGWAYLAEMSARRSAA